MWVLNRPSVTTTNYEDRQKKGPIVRKDVRHSEQVISANHESGADLLIAELKAEVKDQTAAAAEAERLRRKLADSQAHAKELQGQIADLTNTVAKSDREIQSLSTKLEASRAAEVNGKVPGSAIKGANNNKNWTGQSELVHAARVKEDMYSDLTGLLVRGVEEGDEGPVFDCLQTGKNGSKLFP